MSMMHFRVILYFFQSNRSKTSFHPMEKTKLSLSITRVGSIGWNPVYSSVFRYANLLLSGYVVCSRVSLLQIPFLYYFFQLWHKCRYVGGWCYSLCISLWVSTISKVFLLLYFVEDNIEMSSQSTLMIDWHLSVHRTDVWARMFNWLM